MTAATLPITPDPERAAVARVTAGYLRLLADRVENDPSQIVQWRTDGGWTYASTKGKWMPAFPLLRVWLSAGGTEATELRFMLFGETER